MQLAGTALQIAVGVGAGLIATRVNDHAQRVLYRITPERERAREPDSEPTSLVAARKTADALGLDCDRRELSRLKRTIHYGLGGAWGIVYGLLRRHSRMTPVGAGVVTGATLSLVVDEALCPAMGLSRPSDHYPVSTHLRGFVTHLVFGLALAASAEVLHRLAARRPHW
jgi:uncharacterized membrane protein YagU involved in acid resistance